MSIPGVTTYHERWTWQNPLKPVAGPAAEWGEIDTAVIHYTASDDLIDGDPGEHADQLDEYLRAMQQSYVTYRGYSLGYWFAVDWLGGVWQIRGWDIKSAANLDHNDHTIPILVLVDGADAATPEAAASVRAIIAEGQRRAGRTLAIKGHGQLRVETGKGTPTSCPGVGLQSQISTGVFTPRPDPPQNPGVVMTTSTTWQQARIGGDGGFVFGPGNKFVQVPQAVGKKAVTIKLSVVTPNHDGYVVAFLGPQPPTSTVDYKANDIRNGVTTVPVDANGYFALYSSGFVKVLVDLIGVHS